MKKTLILTNPIMVNNELVKALDYDPEEITAQLFAEAEMRQKVAAGTRNVAIVPAVEFDFSLHLYLGIAAVVAVNPQYDFADIERVKGADVMKLSRVGRDFTMQSEASGGSSSDEQSETTPEPTTPQSQNLNENG